MTVDRRACLAALGGLALGAGSRPAAAQAAFPSRPITLMVPWPAGAPSDAMARRLQPALQKAFGQPVVVENLGGAGGSLGVARALQQPADVQERLHRWWSETAREPEFLAWSRSTGSDPLPVMPLAETQAFYQREVARYTTLLKAFPNAARS